MLEDLEVEGCNFKECEESLEKRDRSQEYLMYSQLIKHWKETCQYCDVVCSICLEKFNRITAKQHYKQCVKAIEYLKSIKTCKECGNELKKIYDYICQFCQIKRERQMQNVNEAIPSSISTITELCPACKGRLLQAFKYKCQKCKLINEQISLRKPPNIPKPWNDSPTKNSRKSRFEEEYPFTSANRARSEGQNSFSQVAFSGLLGKNQVKPDHLSKANKINSKFGLENRKGHLSCFLNSCLQALWNLAPMQRDIRTFCQQVAPGQNQDNNNQILKLTYSIKDLYQRIVNSEGNIQFGNIQLSSSNIRKELFKTFYLTNQFNLNKKADVNEALDTILQVIHSTFTHNNGINAQGKYDFDQKCNDCFVHSSFKLNIDTQKKCLCGKQFPQQTHENNFQYIVNIEDLLAIINEHIGSDMHIQSMESPMKKMMSLLPRFIRKSYEQPESICTDQKCNIKHTTMKISIQSPLPNVICLNLNYHNPGFDPLSLLKIFLSIPDTLNIQDLFDTQEAQIPKKDNGKWLLFDDTRVKEIIDWACLVNDCVQALIKPTTLFFQKVPDIMKSKLEVQAKDKFNPTKLEMLNYDLLTIEKKARQQSETMYGLDHAQQIEMMRYFQLQQKQFKSDVGESNSSFQPEPMNSGRFEQSNPGNQPANDAQIKKDIKKCMQYLKEEYLKIGVYLFKCESCQQYMHLNQLFCPYKGCKVRNSFFDETQAIDKDTNYSIMQSIFEVHANDDKRKELLTMIACKNDPSVTVDSLTPQIEAPSAQKQIEQAILPQTIQKVPIQEQKITEPQIPQDTQLNRTISKKATIKNELYSGIQGDSPSKDKWFSQTVRDFGASKKNEKIKPLNQRFSNNKRKNSKFKSQAINKNQKAIKEVSEDKSSKTEQLNQQSEKLNDSKSQQQQQPSNYNLAREMLMSVEANQDKSQKYAENLEKGQREENLPTNIEVKDQSDKVGKNQLKGEEESPRILKIEERKQQQVPYQQYDNQKSQQLDNILQKQSANQRNTYVPNDKDDNFDRDFENLENVRDEIASEDANISEDEQVMTADNVQISQLDQPVISNNLQEIPKIEVDISKATEENHEQQKEESVRYKIQQQYQIKRPFNYKEKRQSESPIQKNQQLVLEQQRTLQEEDEEYMNRVLKNRYKQKHFKRLEEKFEKEEMKKTEKQRLKKKQFLEEQKKKKEVTSKPEGVNNKILEKQQSGLKKQPLNLPVQECYQEKRMPEKEEEKEQRNYVIHSKKEHFNKEQDLEELYIGEDKQLYRKIALSQDQRNEFFKELHDQKYNRKQQIEQRLWKCPICLYINNSALICRGKLKGGEGDCCILDFTQYPGLIDFYERILDEEGDQFNDQQQKVYDFNNIIPLNNKSDQQSDDQSYQNVNDENVEAEEFKELNQKQQVQKSSVANDQMYSKGTNNNSALMSTISDKQKNKQQQQEQQQYGKGNKIADESSVSPPNKSKSKGEKIRSKSSNRTNNKKSSQRLDKIKLQNVWECEFCQVQNTFDVSQLKTCNCIECGEANLNIYEIICASLCQNSNIIKKYFTSKHYIFECVKCGKPEFDIIKRKCRACDFELDRRNTHNEFKDYQFCSKCLIYGIFSQKDICDHCHENIWTNVQKDYSINEQYYMQQNNNNNNNNQYQATPSNNFNNRQEQVSMSYDNFNYYQASEYQKVQYIQQVKNQQLQQQQQFQRQQQQQISHDPYANRLSYQEPGYNMKALIGKMKNVKDQAITKFQKALVVQNANHVNNTYLKNDSNNNGFDNCNQCRECSADYCPHSQMAIERQIQQQQRQNKDIIQKIKCRSCKKRVNYTNADLQQGYVICLKCNVRNKLIK